MRVVVPELKQDCDSIVADFNNKKQAENLQLKRDYEKAKADATNAYNRAVNDEQKAKVKQLEGLYNSQEHFLLEKAKFEMQATHQYELMNSWATHIISINNYAYNVIRTASNLLYLVKRYR
jgi:hypothetical protein